MSRGGAKNAEGSEKSWLVALTLHSTEGVDVMKTTTLTALKAIHDSDPARTRIDREVLIKILGLAEFVGTAKPANRVISFEEAARRLNRTTRVVHSLARQGVIRKAKVPGCSRAAGVLASDLDALLEKMVADEVQ